VSGACPIANCPINTSHPCTRLETIDVDVLVLIFFTPWQAGSKEFYSTLSAHSWYQPDDKWEYQAATDFIGSGARILDIGCGDGRFHKSLPSVDYTGLETSMADESRTLTEKAQILNQPLNLHATASPESYDCVCAFQVLEHVVEPRQFVEQALRCLRPKGKLILGMPNHESYLGGLMNFALNSPPHHLSWWSDRALSALEEELGVTRIALRYAPLEDWEHDLYRMQRLYNHALPEVERYSTKTSWRWRIPAAYLCGKVTGGFTNKATLVQGSTMLWVATR